MPCEFDLNFVDSDTVTFTEVGPSSISAETVDSPCPNCVTLEPNLDGSTTVTQSDGQDFLIPPPGNSTTVECLTTAEITQDTTTGPQIVLTQTGCTPVVLDLCSITGPSGTTGQPVGAEIVGCQLLDLNQQDPETAGFPAASFPVRWRQHFLNGVTGEEVWIVLLDVTGVNQWHQEA